MKARLTDVARRVRLQRMLDLRDDWIKRIKNGEHVTARLQRGNDKTGVNCWTISLMPIADCHNCANCMHDCYDINNVCYKPNVQNDRARNSALHKVNPKLYWEQVELGIKYNFVTQLRLNVGGDLNYDDFKYVKEIAERCPEVNILFFTKNYDELNRFFDEYGRFPSNVKAIMSRWCGVECNNKYNIPESHVLWEDGKTTAPEYGAILCRGDCSKCFYYKDGCWTLKDGESVVFRAH